MVLQSNSLRWWMIQRNQEDMWRRDAWKRSLKTKSKIQFVGWCKSWCRKIWSQYCHGNLLNKSQKRPYSPMKLVEPQLVDFIIQMSRIRWWCLSALRCLLPTTDLIESTEVEKAVVKYKNRIKAIFWKA